MSEDQPVGRDPASQLVVIGSSAGGIDALRVLLSTLPADFAAPVVIAQHLDPRRASALVDVLASASTLPVRSVSGELPLELGHVYVVPADRDVIISDHHVSVRTDTASGSRPSVDRLLATAARSFGDGLVAVVLTGMGSDGAAGAQAVKAYGGTVVVQNPDTARFPGMPESVAPTAVDAVAELDAIGPLLVDILASRDILPAAGDELQTFLQHVRTQSGLDFGAYKRATIERRLQRRMAAAGVSSLADYREYIDRHPHEMQRLVSSFLIKVTQFFRDPGLWDHLRTRVLPDLIARGRARGELRLWSAGCATGEEAYSLAILVADLLGEFGETLPVRIFATDLAPDAVEFARRGIYPANAMEDLPSDIVERHFVRLDGGLEVSKRVRGMVVFGEHDLGRRAPFPRIDLVLCRNVLIYFTPELQRRALHLFAFSLRQGGYLVLGSSETVSPLPDYFALEQSRLKVFRRIGEYALNASLGADKEPLGVGTAPARPSTRRLSPRTSVSPPAPPRELPRVPEHGSVGTAVIDQGYFVRAINGAARNLLGLQGAGIGEDLIHAVPPEIAQPLREAIDRARGGDAASLSLTVPESMIDRRRDLLVSCTPVRQDGKPFDTAGEEPVAAVLLEVTDVSSLGRRIREAEDRASAAVAEAEALRPLADDASDQVRALRSANSRLAEDLAQFLGDNEQLQLANEEAQAASEEIETLNEELQATNEELETLNEELYATVEELTTTNDELQARSVELERVAIERETQRYTGEAERNRLATVLSTMSDAVLMLNADGEPVLANASYDQTFGPGVEWTPEDEQGQPLPRDLWPQRQAAAGNAFTVAFTLPGEGTDRRWFEAKGQPTSSNSRESGVVVIRDITDRSLRHQQEQFLAIAVHELRTPLTALTGRIQLLERRLRRMDADPWLREQVAIALEQAWRLGGGIADLMDAARVQAGKLQLDRSRFDLIAVTQDAVTTASPLSEETPIRIDAPKESIVIDGDARRIGRVMLNLLANALVHAPSAEGVDVRMRVEGKDVIIEVEDNGPGVEASQLPRIFERFYQGDPSASAKGGLGLGLFISREIIEAHGGTIDASSTLGEGTTFVVRLPTGKLDSA
jgi:two-component system, chemotaxis family, CheB/CheR fusion protein